MIDKKNNNFRWNKKGAKFLGEHVVNIVLAVIVVLLLIFLVVKVYGVFQKGEKEKAETQLKKIVEIVNKVKADGQKRKIEVFPPGKNWFLRSFVFEFPVGECREARESCLCVCNKLDCSESEKRACEGFNFDVLATEYSYSEFASRVFPVPDVPKPVEDGTTNLYYAVEELQVLNLNYTIEISKGPGPTTIKK